MSRHPFHQLLHLPHLALEETVHEDFAAVGVKGDGREAGDGGVDEHAGDGLLFFLWCYICFFNVTILLRARTTMPRTVTPAFLCVIVFKTDFRFDVFAITGTTIFVFQTFESSTGPFR